MFQEELITLLLSLVKLVRLNLKQVAGIVRLADYFCGTLHWYIKLHWYNITLIDWYDIILHWYIILHCYNMTLLLDRSHEPVLKTHLCLPWYKYYSFEYRWHIENIMKYTHIIGRQQHSKISRKTAKTFSFAKSETYMLAMILLRNSPSDKWNRLVGGWRTSNVRVN